MPLACPRSLLKAKARGRSTASLNCGGGSGERAPNRTAIRFCAMKQFWRSAEQHCEYFKHSELYTLKVDKLAKFMLCVFHHILFKAGAGNNYYCCKEIFYCKSVRCPFKDDFNVKKKKNPTKWLTCLPLAKVNFLKS